MKIVGEVEIVTMIASEVGTGIGTEKEIEIIETGIQNAEGNELVHEIVIEKGRVNVIEIETRVKIEIEKRTMKKTKKETKKENEDHLVTRTKIMKETKTEKNQTKTEKNIIAIVVVEKTITILTLIQTTLQIRNKFNNLLILTINQLMKNLVNESEKMRKGREMLVFLPLLNPPPCC